MCGVDHACRLPFHFEVENNSLQTPIPGATLIPRDISGVSEVNNGAVIHDVGEQAAQTERLADKMLQQVFALLSRHGIVLTTFRSKC